MRIGKILGIPIFLHSTWVIIFAGLTYSLAIQFGQEHHDWTPAQHWSVGVFTSTRIAGMRAPYSPATDSMRAR